MFSVLLIGVIVMRTIILNGCLVRAAHADGQVSLLEAIDSNNSFRRKECVRAFDSLHGDRLNIAHQYLQVLLNTPDGLTDLEASALLRVKVSTICGRRGDLKKAYPLSLGFVQDSGERRMGDSGLPIVVWEARRDLFREELEKVSVVDMPLRCVDINKYFDSLRMRG